MGLLLTRGVLRLGTAILLARSDLTGPVNIGSSEMVTINQLAQMVMDAAGKKLSIRHVDGPLGLASVYYCPVECELPGALAPVKVSPP